MKKHLKILSIIFILAAQLLAFASCDIIEDLTGVVIGGEVDNSDECQHEWAEATCKEPKHCKLCGESEGEMKTSSAPIMQEDLHATVLDVLGIDAELGYGRSILDISEGEERTRRYHFVRDVKEDGTHEIVIYEIVGSAADLGNWSVTGRIKLDKSIYD